MAWVDSYFCNPSIEVNYKMDLPVLCFRVLYSGIDVVWFSPYAVFFPYDHSNRSMNLNMSLC
jgi:hypothetical protein